MNRSILRLGAGRVALPPTRGVTAVAALLGLADVSVGAQRDTAAAHRSLSPGTGTVLGVVIDSIHGGPLAGAQVMIEGVNAAAATDSSGHFRLAGVPAGAHRMGIFHPLLDSLGIGFSSPPITVPAGDSLGVVFSTPSPQSAVALLCRGAVPGDGAGPSAVVGHVLDAETDEPVAGVRVTMSWIEVQASKEAGLHRVPRARDTTTGPEGGFRFCYMPAGFSGLLRATPSDEASAVSRPYSLSGEYIGFVVVHVPTRTAAVPAAPVTPSSGPVQASPLQSKDRPGAVLVGRVQGADGVPVAGARAVVLGSDSATTSDSGKFTLHGLPTGTRTLEVRAVGWEPVSMSVELTTSQVRQVVVSLGEKTVVLRTILVSARLNAGLRSVGFDQRKKAGIGRFLSPEDIEKRDPMDFHDLLRGIPGIMISYGRDGRASVRGTRGGGSCVGYMIDGMPVREMAPGEIDSWVRPSEIGAVEVYQGPESPLMYASPQSGLGCMTVVIWTKTRLGL